MSESITKTTIIPLPPYGTKEELKADFSSDIWMVSGLLMPLNAERPPLNPLREQLWVYSSREAAEEAVDNHHRGVHEPMPAEVYKYNAEKLVELIQNLMRDTGLNLVVFDQKRCYDAFDVLYFLLPE